MFFRAEIFFINIEYFSRDYEKGMDELIRILLKIDYVQSQFRVRKKETKDSSFIDMFALFRKMAFAHIIMKILRKDQDEDPNGELLVSDLLV